ncbi:hypothetical protein NRIC_35340 [Enterococcus florum]|uniref:Core domain-containing protein n=1 Tax=Enterococcus florum TaxID=2480627 RepID=A0A4P5PSR8_9ENTE|nr:iron-sulfur cluster biosynthesis family protein [Enterococcus florum]GCF95643.1 hypothetical protein NRIC_35340 [Enterococcus florum]
MEIYVTDSAAEVLNRKVGDDKAFLIALNDPSNGFAAHEWFCAKGSAFQIVPIFTPVEGYDTRIQNPEFNVYISKHEKPSLGEQLTMDFDTQMNSFQLKCEKGTLDSNIKLAHYFFS